ncbi:uncharacterized protein K460DRAFT_253464, partial [Cucurbitaria berberidis CBS 394.84]
LNLMMMFLLISAFGIFTSRLRSHIIMNRRERNDVAGEYKTVLELAHAMQTQLAKSNSRTEDIKDFLTMTEKDLHHYFIAGLHGGTISYQAPLPLNEDS